MKYTIDGFSQEKIIKYDLNDRHLKLLSYLRDYAATSRMVTIKKGNDTFYWFKYDGFMKEYPYLKIKNPKVVGELLLELHKKCLVEKHTERNPNGTYIFIRLTTQYQEMLSANHSEYCIGDFSAEVDGKIAEGTPQNRRGYTLKSQSYNPSTNNPSTNNPNSKEKNTKKEIFDFDGFNEEQVKAIKNWLDYRNEIKKPYKSQQTLDMLKKELIKNTNLVRDIEFSIARGYQGIYQPNNQYNQRQDTKEVKEVLKRCNSQDFSGDF